MRAMNKTRFAPSPTGYLHVGGARTALYSWLYARKHQDKFVLRIEDTDPERSTKEAIDAILEGMEWLGLDYDEGPFYQTQRFERYKELANKLLKEGKAYRCYCSKERLDQIREEMLEAKQKPRYDGHCRNLADQDLSKSHVIRFKNPSDGSVVFEDAIRGTVETQNSELDDLIIFRSDGTPTYNFTVVVDDYDMEIDMVMRGEDHVSNTPRQINILQALGATIPKYAHIPMILGEDGKRLSKRHGAVSVLQYKEDGYLPEALLNYLVRLGWSHGDQELFSLNEMIDLFDLEHVSKSAAAFNTEKLNWINQHYLKNLPVERIVEELKYQLKKIAIDHSNGPKLEKVVEAFRERVHTIYEMAERAKCYFVEEIIIDKAAADKHITAEIKKPLQALYNKLATVDKWDVEKLHACIHETIEEFEIKMPKLAQPVRIAVTGSTMSPSLDVTLYLVGRERALKRIHVIL